MNSAVICLQHIMLVAVDNRRARIQNSLNQVARLPDTADPGQVRPQVTTLPLDAMAGTTRHPLIVEQHPAARSVAVGQAVQQRLDRRLLIRLPDGFLIQH